MLDTDQAEKNAQNPQPNYFVQIPYHILDNPNIDDSTAILYGRISSLTNKYQYCFASDKYLAELSDVTVREIQRRMKILEDFGYIRRETTKNGMFWDRKIYVNYNFKFDAKKSEIKNNSTKRLNGPFESDHMVHFDTTPRSTEQCKQCTNISNEKNIVPKPQKTKIPDTPLTPEKPKVHCSFSSEISTLLKRFKLTDQQKQAFQLMMEFIPDADPKVICWLATQRSLDEVTRMIKYTKKKAPKSNMAYLRWLFKSEVAIPSEEFIEINKTTAKNFCKENNWYGCKIKDKYFEFYLPSGSSQDISFNLEPMEFFSQLIDAKGKMNRH